MNSYCDGTFYNEKYKFPIRSIVAEQIFNFIINHPTHSVYYYYL